MRNECLQKILDLKAQKKTHLEAAAAANDKNDVPAYERAMQDVADVQAEIDRTQAIVDEMGPETAGTPAGGHPHVTPEGTGRKENRRATNEYANAFAWALSNGVSPKNAREVSDNRVTILMDALTETGGDPVGSDGGFLVPEDVETRIHELRRTMSALAPLFNVETVTTRTGYRNIDTKPNEGFVELTEMGQIPETEQPKFRRVGYTVKDYGGFLPISNDLLEDNTAGLIAYLARWFAKKGVLTENKLLLPSLMNLPCTNVAVGREVAAIKTALNVGLDPDIALTSKFVTNQTGINILDLLVDNNGRPLLQPDPTQPTRHLFIGRPVTVLANAQMPDLAAGAPLCVGDPEELATLFRRKGLEVESTRIGGSAWRTNSTEIRGITRLATTTFDTEAVKLLALPLGNGPTASGEQMETEEGEL